MTRGCHGGVASSVALAALVFCQGVQAEQGAQKPAAKQVSSAPAPAPTLTSEQRAAVDRLVAKARADRLAQQETWIRLVRYRRGLLGWKSEADAKTFFLSPSGKTDPEAELEATIRGFFGPDPSDPDLQHPYCRFPARLAWLNAHLNFEKEKLPRRVCERFQQFYTDLRPRSLTLVFSSYYLNNPASAFGHTFLRVNKYGRGDDGEGRELLDYGIDYSATVDTNNSLLYAFKGLVGMFPGEFRRVPFYLKVREYNDFESRDLWEYELNLTHQEVSMVIAHLWEMGSNYFDYFYLSENCSYHILGALEVASPRLRLLDKVGWPVIPSDTIKAITSVPGLTSQPRFRPSNRTQFMARVNQLSSAEKSALDDVVEDPAAPMPAWFDLKTHARVLDVALDLNDFRFARDKVADPGQERDLDSANLEHALLQRRASLMVESEDLHVPPPLRKMPHLGHGSFRLGLGSGYLQDRGAYHGMNLRLALHDMADATAGYPDHAAIEFLPARLRYYVEAPAVSVEDFSLVRVLSLVPWNRYEKRMSWSVRVGGSRVRDEACDGCFAGVGEIGVGASASAFSETLLAWFLGETRLLTPVDGGVFDAVRVGAGPSAGLRVLLGDSATWLTTGRAHYLPMQTPKVTWEASSSFRIHYLKDFALSLESNVQPDAWSAEAVSFLYF
jgi:hypothetical protein